MRANTRKSRKLGTGAWRWIALFSLMIGVAGANIPLQPQESSTAASGTDLARKSKQARESARAAAPQSPARANPPTAPRGPADDELGPLQDLPSTATVFLLDPAKPERIETIDVGQGLKLTGRIRMGDAEVYIIEPEGDLPFDLPILSLAEAQKDGLVEVREITPVEAQGLRAQYPSGGGGMVVAKNKGDVYVLFVGGEVLDGGHQDRMVATSAILPPKSGWVPLPVNCVEKGRGQGPRGTFHVADALAHPVLRAHSLCEANQRAVWGEIDRTNHVEKSAGPTHTYMNAILNGRDRAAIGKATNEIGGILKGYPRAVGLVFVRGGVVQSVERMATPALFQQEKKSILESHLMGLATRMPVGAGATTSPKTVAAAPPVQELKSFFKTLQSAERLRAPLNHQGVGVVVRGSGILGGETLTNLAPRDPALREFAADLSRKGPAPNVLNQWAVRVN